VTKTVMQERTARTEVIGRNETVSAVEARHSTGPARKMTATERTAAYMAAECADVYATQSGVSSPAALCPQRYRERQHKRRDGRDATHTR